jgi:hypothetical protein
MPTKGGELRENTTILIVVVIAFAFAGNSVASGLGKSIEYPGGDAGKVVFNGDTHGMA